MIFGLKTIQHSQLNYEWYQEESIQFLLFYFQTFNYFKSGNLHRIFKGALLSTRIFPQFSVSTVCGLEIDH